MRFYYILIRHSYLDINYLLKDSSSKMISTQSRDKVESSRMFHGK